MNRYLKNDHQSKKIDRLDNAFLFSLASVGLGISFIQVAFKDLTGVMEAIPFLLLGIVLPFYVGYMRGAIEIDSYEERMRGWIYFIIGTSSYLAFFVHSRFYASYTYTESLFHFVIRESPFYFIITCGSTITYLLLKWSNKVFDIDNASIQYAFSGTALGSVGIAFLPRLIISLYIDFQDKDIYGIILSNPSDLLFWISIILASVSIVLIFEKGSRNVLRTELELPKNGGILGKIRNFFIIKGLILGLMLFESALLSGLKAGFLWSQAFAFWILGCFVWVARIPFFPQAFFLLTVIFALIAGIIFCRMPTIRFENIEKIKPIKSGYCMNIFVSIFTMVITSSIPTGVLLILLSTIAYATSYLSKRTKRKKSEPTYFY